MHEAGFFSGVEKLYKFVKIDGVHDLSRKQVKHWLEWNDMYTLHRPIRRNFTKSRVMTYGMDDVWQMDLVDLASQSKHNAGYKYLLICISMTYLNLLGKSLVSALNKIIKKSMREPYHIQTDKGTEFMNRVFQTFLKDKDILFYTIPKIQLKRA